MEDELLFNVPQWKLQCFQNPPSQTSFTETITPGSEAGGMSVGRDLLKHVVLDCQYAKVNMQRLSRVQAI